MFGLYPYPPECFDPTQKPEPGTPVNFESEFAQNLLAYWPIWEGAGGAVEDVSGNSNALSLKAGAAWAANSFGTTMRCIASAAGATLSPTSTYLGPFTLSVDLVIANFSQVNTYFSGRGAGGLSNGCDFKISATQVHADIGSASGFLTTSANAAFSFVAGVRYLITYSVSTTGYSVYVNGRFIGSGAFAGVPELWNPTNGVAIGTGPEAFAGDINSVSVANVALTADQIARQFAEPYSMFAPPAMDWGVGSGVVAAATRGFIIGGGMGSFPMAA